MQINIQPHMFLFLLAPALAIIQLDINRSEQRLRKRSDNSSHEISLQNSISYYKTELLIGNPPQRVAVQIDTGSSDLWVISSLNPLCGTTHSSCAYSSTFDAERSQTFQANRTQPFGITYGDNTFASGFFAQDDIVFGTKSIPADTRLDQPFEKRGQNSFLIKRANFALAERANSSEAVWGIGMTSTESIARHLDASGNVYPTYPNLPVQMKQQGLIDTVSYSLWLNNLQSSTGSVLFGGVDHAKYDGSLQTVPLVNTYKGLANPIDFSVMLNGISAYNGNNDEAKIVECKVPVLLDSGTTYTQLPIQFIEPIAKAIGAFYDRKNNMYLVEGSRRKQLKHGGLAFNISGIVINVPMDELLIPATPIKHFRVENNDKSLNGLFGRPDDIFVLGILPMDEGVKSAYILGDTFLRSAYVVYDLERKEISLANALHNNVQNSSIEAINSDGVPNATKAPLYSSTDLDSRITTYSVSGLFNPMGPHHTVQTVASGTQSLRSIPTNAVTTSANVFQASKTHLKHKNAASTKSIGFFMYLLWLF